MRFARKGIGNVLFSLLVTLIVGGVYFYVSLPALNLHDSGFYSFILTLCVVYAAISLLSSKFDSSAGFPALWAHLKKKSMVVVVVAVLVVTTLIVGGFSSAVIFRSGAYSRLLNIEQGDFAADVEEISFDQIPMLDKDSAQKLATRKLGELSDMVSQFEVSDNYTQINYNGKPVRVTSLVYGDLIKWLGNRAEGIPAYMIIDMVTQDVEVKRLDEGIKYSTSEHFGRYVYRRLRFAYPTFMFSALTFEIDDNGNPYWVCPRLVKTIGLFGGTDIRGAVLINAVTGESTYYEDVPAWVDRVYSAELIMEQYDYYGNYHNGYFNSMFGQRDVTVTTDGYNYIAINDDVYVYTGVTSVGTDQSNIGFLLSNQRTKETKFYSVAGAEEYSAEASAEGVVQHLNYDATFPLLLNISSQPTYFMALKDDAGLVKMYAMVNVQQYQIVATGTSVAECEQQYKKLLQQGNITDGQTAEETGASGTITDIRSAVIEGNSYYYIQLEGSEVYYILSAADNELAVILNVGDAVNIQFSAGSGSILSAYSIERAQ